MTLILNDFSARVTQTHTLSNPSLHPHHGRCAARLASKKFKTCSKLVPVGTGTILPRQRPSSCIKNQRTGQPFVDLSSDLGTFFLTLRLRPAITTSYRKLPV